MLLASILLALVMERPLMFFNDEPGLLPSADVAVPTETRRITKNHFAELYGAASAVMERNWRGAELVTNNITGGYIQPDKVQLRDLPSGYIYTHPYQTALYYPSNRVIRSYRVTTPWDGAGTYWGAFGPAALHTMADCVLIDRTQYGSSLISGDDPPTFDWCANPLEAASSNEWISALKTFQDVTNDIPAARWTLYNPEEPNGSMSADAVSMLKDLTVYDGSEPNQRDIEEQFDGLVEAIRSRAPSESITGLMQRAVRECSPVAVTNRTLRFDRNFLTALDAAASLEDTYCFKPSTRWCNHVIAYGEKYCNKIGYANGQATISVTPSGDLVGVFSCEMPQMPADMHYSVTTNQMNGDTIRCSALHTPATSAEWGVFAGGIFIHTTHSNLLEAVAAANLRPGESVALFPSQRHGAVVTWAGTTTNGTPVSLGCDISENNTGTCSCEFSVSAFESCKVIWPAGFHGDLGYEDNFMRLNHLYWRNRRIEKVDAWLQEGMRWSDRYDDAERVPTDHDATGTWISRSYYEMDPFSDTEHRSQTIRHRHGLSMDRPNSLAACTNSLMASANQIVGECIQKCSEIAGGDVRNPAAFCRLTESDLDAAVHAAENAIGSPMDVYVWQNYSITLSMDETWQAFATIKSSLWDPWEETVLLDPDSTELVDIGFVELSKSGEVPISGPTNTPARVDCAQGEVMRLRIKYYNLSNLNDQP